MLAKIKTKQRRKTRKQNNSVNRLEGAQHRRKGTGWNLNGVEGSYWGIGFWLVGWF